MSPRRGSLGFDVTDAGDLVDSAANAERLRGLWLDRSMINGADLGPGNPGDFDDGAWHVGCHLVAAGGVRRLQDGRLAWLELSHDPAVDEYYASVTVTENGRAKTIRAESVEARTVLAGSALVGFVEGNSTGHISARGVNDPPTRFNKWQRQDFDQPANRRNEGGKVWEHWCTLRQLRTPDLAGASVVRAYVTLVAALGDRFAPTVARGRREYGHPQQLCALVRAGFVSEASVTWDTRPEPIPAEAQASFLEARPADEVKAAAQLRWSDVPRYYMFRRRIDRWSPANKVRQDLQRFGG